jgi:hypothetical protein
MYNQVIQHSLKHHATGDAQYAPKLYLVIETSGTFQPGVNHDVGLFEFVVPLYS